MLVSFGFFENYKHRFHKFSQISLRWWGEFTAKFCFREEKLKGIMIIFILGGKQIILAKADVVFILWPYS